MKRITQSFVVLFVLLAMTHTAIGEHRVPNSAYTTHITFDNESQKIESQPFLYESPNITLHGTVTLDPLFQKLKIEGTYTSHQNLEPGINLAFQIYGPENTLLFREGDRTPFEKQSDNSDSIAQFTYEISIPNIAPEKETDSLVVQFNYVKEFEYWADQKFPDMELPALSVKGVDSKDPISVGFSWIPSIIPQGIKTYSFHAFSVSPNLESAAMYSPSVEGYLLSDRRRQENYRYNLDPEKLGQSEFLVAEMDFDQTGRANRRLGFVLDGVRWHNRPPSTYKSSWILPIWTYSAVVALYLALLSFVFHFASTVKKRKAKIALGVIGFLLSLIFLLEFTSQLMPFYLTIFATVIIASRSERVEYATYWTLLFFTISQEFIWAAIQNDFTPKSYALPFASLVAAVALAPIVLVKKPWVTTIFANVCLICIASYYITLNLYFVFFEDFPTWNVFTYASQGIDIADSIVSLLDQRHTIVGISILFFLVAINSAKIITKKSS